MKNHRIYDIIGAEDFPFRGYFMVELKNVSKFYNDNGIVTVGLRNVSLKLNKGEFVAITGDSGSGKSTLLNVISSVDIYDDGEILYYGNETFYFNRDDSDLFRKNNVAFIFQKYNIVDSYTVLQNVMLPLLIKGVPEEDAKVEALGIIKRVGLEHRAENKGSKLSGGEKQRCVIARALATDAPILACDEPTGNLDKKTGAEIIALIKEVAADKLVLVVTHDYESIKDVATRKIKMSDGEVVEDVTFAPGIDEGERELNLGDTRPTGRILRRLAMLNVASTPKKSVFSSLVFTFVSCIFLLLTMFMIQISYNENYTYSDSYGIISDDRIIIYADDHSPLDMDKLRPLLEGLEYYENAFYEEGYGANIRIDESLGHSAALTFHSMDFELIHGTDTPKDGEFVLVMPRYYYTDIYSTVIGEEITILAEAEYDYRVPIGKLAGVGISDEVNAVYLLGAPTDTVASIVINKSVSLNCSSTASDASRFNMFYDETAEKSYLAIPTALKDKINTEFNLGNIYPVSYGVEVVYTDYHDIPTFVVGDDYLRGALAPDFGGVRELTVYTDDVVGLEKAVSKLGYDASIPSMVENDDGVSRIVLYMLSTLIVAAMVIMFYVSFAIMQRIYMTKAKDYSIFRTLGLVSADLKKILYIEVIATAVVSMIIGAILTNLIIIASETDLYKYVSPALMIIYTAVMPIFGAMIAARLNSKIFHHSVYQSLKEGEA